MRRHHSHKGEPESATECFERMLKAGLGPDMVTYNALVISTLKWPPRTKAECTWVAQRAARQSSRRAGKCAEGCRAGADTRKPRPWTR